MVMEASFGWGWLSDEMVAAGLEVALSNCYKLEQMRKARGLAKTNKKDADLLSLLPFEAEAWWKVWMAPPEVRDLRERMRYRSSLVGVQTETKSRISALLHRHGILHGFSDLFGARGRGFLMELRRRGGTAEVVLAEGARGALGGLLELLGHLREQLARVGRELHGQLERNVLAQRLDRIPGIGLILAHTMMAEIGRIGRFRNHRALASYSLLGPIADETGEQEGRKPLGRHLGHRGNRTLKWAFLEAAHGAVRKGGKWRRLFDSLTEGGTKNRNDGYIKVARELVTVVYVVWKKEVDYTDCPPPRPGSSAGRRARALAAETRSGTGQPYLPMVAVR